MANWWEMRFPSWKASAFPAVPLLVPLLSLPLLAAFPPLEWRWLAWLALAPLFLLVKNGPGGAAAWFGLGWGFGAFFFAFQYSWLARTMVELGGLPVAHFAVFSVVAISVLALLPALSFGLARLAWLRCGFSPYFSLPALLAVQDAVLGVAPFGGAPWGSLASPQTPALAAAVLAPLTGGSGVVLALGAVNSCWAWWAEGFRFGWRSPFHKNPLLRRAALPLLLTLAAAPAWPWAPVWHGAAPREPGQGDFQVLLVPGNFSNAPTGAGGSIRANGSISASGSIRASGSAEKDGVGRFRRFVARTMAALPLLEPETQRLRVGGAAGAKVARLIVWPESAVKGRIEEGNGLEELSLLAGLLEADFLLGSEAMEGKRPLNSVYLVTGGPPTKWRRYDKRELVPFGEYVPKGFRWVFGGKITAGASDYAPGRAPPVFSWGGRGLGLAICFESILPAHMRAAARAGAGVIMTVANDDWLTPAAGLQHLRLTALRGMEIGREVVFVSNRGRSAHLVGAEVVAGTQSGGGPLVANPAVSAHLTPWVRWGYLPLAALLAGWCFAGLLGAWMNPRSRASRASTRFSV